MHVSVQQKHIDEARQYYKREATSASGLPMARCCPIALAICDMLHVEPGYDTVCVYTHIHLMHVGYVEFRADTPDRALRWMGNFDIDPYASHDPFEFDIKLEVVE